MAHHTVKAVVCEVWSRVVGYYRPVQDFAGHKKEEFKDRHTNTIGEAELKRFPSEPVKREELS